eukprot:TRINITY_DN1505_c0_g1_i2.p1 TRINITY_DN1505_c0_g1~~TRINITY_DN1505_c0_g1_i2.p1  ORF type:complete len:233 (-),score=56.29 TRINITY_DN1505_c0_g1_i2:131-829(-)
MSKFRVHAVLDGLTRSIELDRRHFKFNDLRSKVATKFGTNSFSLTYSGSRGSIDVSDDTTFQQAVKDALQTKSKFLNVTVHAAGGYKPPVQAAAHQQQQQTRSAPPQHHQQPAQHSQSGGGHSQHGSAATPPGTLKSFHVSASPGASSDRVVVKYNQETDYFMFTAQPAQHDTTVAVLLQDPKKLQFVCTWSFQEGPVVRSMQASQTFNLPFEVTADLLTVNGNNVKLTMPR